MRLHPAGDTSRSLGEVTSAAWSFGLESWAGLGYVKRGFAGAPLETRSSEGAAIGVQVRDLPPVPPDPPDPPIHP
jgi:hypothetical protein